MNTQVQNIYKKQVTSSFISQLVKIFRMLNHRTSRGLVQGCMKTCSISENPKETALSKKNDLKS